MRIAVVSDIHGNWDALAAVLEDIDTIGVDSIICLGDCIGYGAEPDRVLQTMQQRGIPSMLGNHEQAVLEPKRLDWFNPLARQSLVKTAAMLTENSRRYINGFPSHSVLNGCRFVHGFPPDSVTTYYFEVPSAEKRRILSAMPEAHCFIGHTHDLKLVDYDGRTLTEAALTEEPVSLIPQRRYVVSVGSVGQPRDGDNRAKYVIWDARAKALRVRYVSYDIAAAAAKIIAAGMPRIHADRLW